METVKTGEDAARNVQVSFFVAECMEFVRYGEYMEGIPSIEKALEYYDKIPPDRLSARKGIGIHIHDPEDQNHVQEFQLLTGNDLNLDIIQMFYGFEDYPQILEAAKKLVSLRPSVIVIDSGRLLDKQKLQNIRKIDAMKLAGMINELEKRLDADFYESFYPDAAVPEGKTAMRLLMEEGKEEYLSWLEDGNFSQFPEFQKEAQDIRNFMEKAEIIWPEMLSPFVYIEFSEDACLENGDLLPIEEADLLFGDLDRLQVTANKKDGALGYNKTKFRICYQRDGETGIYEGRQDFGDGEGSLLDHVEAFQNYYLNTEDGQMDLQGMEKKQAERIKEDCEYVRDELLPFLRYFCNLYAIEKAIHEEQKAGREVPLLTDRQEARREYQADMLAFIKDSRRVLNLGGELPRMPDIKDYQETKEKQAYREHVMKEIEAEAKMYHMTVEAYAKNGYEPIKDYSENCKIWKVR